MSVPGGNDDRAGSLEQALSKWPLFSHSCPDDVDNLAASHSRTVQSWEPEATTLPSGEKATLLTQLDKFFCTQQIFDSTSKYAQSFRNATKSLNTAT